MTIEELKQVLEAATPGPWNRIDLPRNDLNPHGTSVVYVRDDAVSDGRFHIAELSMFGRGGNNADAHLIVGAVNNLPKLLKLAEAAQNLPRLIDQASASRRDVDYIKVSDEIELLRKALEELNNDH